MGVTQFDNLSDLWTKLTNEARQALDNFLDKWDFENAANPHYEEAIRREADREEDQMNLVYEDLDMDANAQKIYPRGTGAKGPDR